MHSTHSFNIDPEYTRHLAAELAGASDAIIPLPRASSTPHSSTDALSAALTAAHESLSRKRIALREHLLHLSDAGYATAEAALAGDNAFSRNLNNIGR